jgi:hypothetical protein
MTPTATATRTAQTLSAAEVRKLLRDAAFVLKMTRRVKEEMVRDAAGLKAPRVAAERAAAALGV